MPCCGQKLSRQTGTFEDLALNERSMLLLAGDSSDCDAYNGDYTGTHFYVAGYGTEHERMFLRQDRRLAISYARERGVKLSTLINSRSFCRDRVIGLLGA